nr:protein STPG3 [Pogona vitticeps]
MEFRQKQVKFLAQQYLDNSRLEIQPQASLLYRRHLPSHRSHLNRETSTQPIFPDIHSGRKNRRGASPEGRLQLILNVDSPGPAAYSPPCVNFRETCAPSYTFGWKTPPREGGGRRSWQKSWFLCKNPFIRKTDFATETNWPSPFDYGQTLGSQLVNCPTSPNFTIGQKTEFSFVNKNTVNDPAPNRYNTEQAYKHIVNRSPSFVISPAPHLIYRWPRKEGTPGPAAYNVERGHIARLPSTPSFFIQGVRRPKRHETGPFSAL